MLLGEIDRRRLLAELDIAKTILDERAAADTPLALGIPDLLRAPREDEDDASYRLWQDEQLKQFIESRIYFVKDGKRTTVRVIPEMLRFLADGFYRRQQHLILWKPRGSGGSLAVGILVWLMVVYHKMSFLLLAGSEKQGKIVYNYVISVWNCFPELMRELLAKEPTVTHFELKNGVMVDAIPATEKAVRGEHRRGLIVDEACVLPGTWIITARGMRKIEDIEVGELVWTHRGRFSRVSDVSVREKQDELCCRIRPICGMEYATTADHRWLDAQGVWRDAATLEPRDKLQFARPMSVADGAPRPRWLTGEVAWRFLGRFLGNGHTDLPGHHRGYDINITVRRAKSGYHDSLLESIQRIFGVEATCCDEREGSYRVRFAPGKEIVAGLRAFAGQGAHAKGIDPAVLLNATDSELREFVLGMLETDGCVSQETSMTGGACDRIFYKTVSDLLCMNLYLVAARFGWNPAIKRRAAGKVHLVNGWEVGGGESWEIVFSGSVVYELAPQLVDDFADRRTKRPMQRVGVTASGLQSPISKITKFVYTGPVYDLTVEDDHSFSAPYATFHNCQRDWSTDNALHAAMNSTMSETDRLLVLVSTFHLPTGIFQSVWDSAKEREFEQYKWSILDAMAPCRKQIDCRNCYLTEPVPIVDKKGIVEKYRYTECAGKARTSVGWKTYDEVATSKRKNIGTQAYSVEFLCERPEYGHTVYNLAHLRRANEGCPVNEYGEKYVPWEMGDEKVIGIDWGMHQTFLVLLTKRPEYLGVVAAAMFSGVGMREIVALLRDWEATYSTGRIEIMGDSSHFFNNDGLHQLGFNVTPVPFVTYKDTMIENVGRYLAFGRLWLHRGKPGTAIELLWSQMNGYRRDRKGKPVKENDHGPDALSLAALNFSYTDHFAHLDIGGAIQDPELNVRIMEF